MLWQYKTVLFEFTKDGILGDRYVDDEEMEKTLNELGRQSWELVNVSLLQDGLLAFLKRVVEEEAVPQRATTSTRREEARPTINRAPAVEPAIAVNPPPPPIESRTPQMGRQPLLHDPLPTEDPAPRRSFERPLRSSRKENDDNDSFGGIRIS